MKIVYFVMVWNIQVKISALGWGGGRGLKYLAHLDSLVEHICCFMFHSGWAAALWDGSNVTKQKCFMHAMLACKHAHTHTHTHTHTRMQAQILSCMIDGLTFHFDIALFSASEETRCTLVAYWSEWVIAALHSACWISTQVLFDCCVAGATWNCCHPSAHSV